MNTENFNEAFFAQVREEEVWKELLQGDDDFVWTEALIERFQDKIDWKLLSGNRSVQWTTRLLDKYKEKLDWDDLSNSHVERLFTSENLRKFQSYWNWSNLSNNSSVGWTAEKIEEFKDLIQWDKFIDYYGCYSEYIMHPQAFFDKYKGRFSVSAFKDSSLWDAMVEKHKKQLIAEIFSK
jgi:hypothetical protein